MPALLRVPFAFWFAHAVVFKWSVIAFSCDCKYRIKPVSRWLRLRRYEMAFLLYYTTYQHIEFGICISCVHVAAFCIHHKVWNSFCIPVCALLVEQDRERERERERGKRKEKKNSKWVAINFFATWHKLLRKITLCELTNLHVVFARHFFFFSLLLAFSHLKWLI